MHSLINKLNINVRGVVVCNDEMVLPAARLAEKIGLPHANIKGLENTYHKSIVRNILEKAHIKQPKYIILDIQSASNHSPEIKFPFVVKPVRGTRSRDVYLCRDENDYKKAITKIKAQKPNCYGVKSESVLLEEFIGGAFYAVDLLWNNDKWNFIGFHKLFLEPYKSLCLTGASFPSDIPPRLLPSVQRQILEWIELVELKGGALHIEFKIYKDIPYLIEINPRLGGPVNKRIELSLGISPIEYVIDQACGVEKEIHFNTFKPKRFIGDAFIFPEKAGLLYEINTSNINIKDYIEIVYDFKDLPLEVQTDQHLGSRIGRIITSGNSADEAMHKASSLVKKVDLKIKQLVQG
jgi:biotin carboxylase